MNKLKNTRIWLKWSNNCPSRNTEITSLANKIWVWLTSIYFMWTRKWKKAYLVGNIFIVGEGYMPKHVLFHLGFYSICTSIEACYKVKGKVTLHNRLAGWQLPLCNSVIVGTRKVQLIVILSVYDIHFTDPFDLTFNCLVYFMLPACKKSIFLHFKNELWEMSGVFLWLGKISWKVSVSGSLNWL